MPQPPDPTRCPDCGGPVATEPYCPSCGLLLRGPDAMRLWQVSVDLARLETLRESLLVRLRPQGATPAVPPPLAAPAAPAPAYAWPPARPVPPPRPRREWTPRRVQNLLLTIGALLLVTAAIAFTALAWGRLPIAARGAIMLGVTAIAGWTADRVLRRGLTASAEAIALLAVLFAVVDAYAARRANLGGLRGTDGATYWSVASGVVAALSAAYGQLVRVRSVRLAALIGAQLPLAITAFRLDGLTLAERGAFIVGQAAVLGALARYAGGYAWAARISGLVNWSVAACLALATAFGSGSDHDVRVAALVLVAAGAVALLWPGDATVPAGVATLAVVAGAGALAQQLLTTAQTPAAVSAIGLLVVVGASSVPYGWRRGPLAVGGATVALAFAAVAPYVLAAAVLPFGWLEKVWLLTADGPARDLLRPSGEAWGGTLVPVVVAAVTAVALAVVGYALSRWREVAWPLVAVVTLAVLVAPLSFGWTYLGALAWDTGLGIGALAVAAGTRRVVVAVPASAVLAVATVWSLADERATLAVLAAATVAYAAYALADPAAKPWAAAVSAAGVAGYAVAAAAAVDTPVDRVGVVLAVTACVLAGAGLLLRLPWVEAVAAVAYVVALFLAATGVGWLAWSFGIGAVAAAALAIRRDRRLLAGLAAALGAACAGTTAVAYGAPVERTGFVVAVAAAAAVGAGAWLDDEAGDLVESVAALAYLAALGLAVGDLGWLSWVLALGGVVSLADALRASRRPLNWVATVLLTAWSWDRLWLADVRVPEAYAAPVVVLTLALGFVRRRREPQTGSWAAYGRGLVAGFVPTTYLVLTDPGVTRPVLLAVAGVAVLLAGVKERLQAPLTVGALALAVDAVVQLAPAVAAAPKWVTLGLAGLAVIAVGVTYEDRRRDMRRLRETYDRLA